MTQLKPLQDRIIVRQKPAPKTTEGGLHLPDSIVQGSQEPEGEVLAIGPGRLLNNGLRAPMTVRVGDQVHYMKYAATEIIQNGETVLILSEKDVLAVVAKDPVALIQAQLQERQLLDACDYLIEPLVMALAEHTDAEILTFFNRASALAEAQGERLDDVLEQLLLEMPQSETAEQQPEPPAKIEQMQAQLLQINKAQNDEAALLRGEYPFALQEEIDS